MKAIHNYSLSAIVLTFTVFNTSKIQNESNSQLVFARTSIVIYCFQYFKDTK